MFKNELRKKYKTLRKRLSPSEIEDKSIAIANQLLKVEVWTHLYFHLYLSIEKQKGLDPIKEILLNKTTFFGFLFMLI